jgi:hypothetical protein
MTAPYATCELWVDGVRVHDTAPDLIAGRISALSSLKLTWGRDGQNEQPGPASCQFQLVDPAGNDTILDVLHVGSAVAVWSEGETTADPGTPGTVQTFDDGTFNTWPAGPLPAAWSSWTPADPYDATIVAGTAPNQLLELSGLPPFTTWTLRIPPRPFSPAGTLPDAWDDIPRYSFSDGTPWDIRFQLRVPTGWTADWGVVKYTAPYAGSYTTAVVGTVVGDGTLTTVDHAWSSASQAEQVWIGLLLTVHPTDLYTWQVALGDWAGQTGSWADQAVPTVYVDDIVIGPPSGGVTTRRVLVFNGQVSDVQVVPAGDGQSTLIGATAMDMAAQLGHTVIGDDPWPVHTAGYRANRVAELAGISTTPRVRVDAPLNLLQLSARDVDAQPSIDLLSDLAQSVGGVLWVATHAVTGPYLWIENTEIRAAVRQFVEAGGIITISGATRDVATVSACDLLEDPVSWTQDSADVVTVVQVGWAQQGVDDEGVLEVTDRTVTVTDTAALAMFGTRSLSIATELIAESDATDMADRLLRQARAVGWRLNGLVWDTATTPDTIDSLSDATRQAALMSLLDGTIRMGLAVTLLDMPPYAPRGATSGVYVEGGDYEFRDGFWVLSLTTTPSAGQGRSATWAEVGAAHPTWAWNQWAPDLTWVDTLGTAV